MTQERLSTRIAFEGQLSDADARNITSLSMRVHGDVTAPTYTQHPGSTTVTFYFRAERDADPSLEIHLTREKLMHALLNAGYQLLPSLIPLPRAPVWDLGKRAH